jgi:coenzyme F420-0:L-glutamate ligase/coenzyme F420-1:gamma-L-glutamate ligase
VKDQREAGGFDDGLALAAGPVPADADATAAGMPTAVGHGLGARPSGVVGGRVEIVALDGIGEVALGDDVGAIVADAIAATPGLLPLRSDDVLVVTQKIVSKAEGAIVDLREVEPRREAVAFGARWDRDPRQVEVVLREAVRIVRMDRGVVITETRHGFVLANSGVDASNVGPLAGDVVTLLPVDPDASARRIRDAVRERYDVDVAVVISDSFGRPWRWGIVDVAIGVSGLAPVEDLRGAADADGRVMRSTIRATADEIASAAELALGKTARRPVALVRGAMPKRAEGGIGDVIMSRSFDLFP